MLAAINSNGEQMEYASETLRNDKEIALAACQTGLCLKFEGSTLQIDAGVVALAMAYDSNQWQSVGADIQNKYRLINISQVKEMC